MCDASDYAAGVVLVQSIDTKIPSIYYASHSLKEAQVNYTVTKKEFLAISFACQELRPYLIGSHVVIFTDVIALQHLFEKKDAKPRLIRWITLL